MSAAVNCLAFDLGASSGRAVVGRFDGDRLSLVEEHRFANDPVRIVAGGREHLHWDTLRLFGEVKRGIGLAAGRHPDGLASLGVDTWGVDFALLDRDGALLGNPHHYRDRRTEGMLDEAFRRVSREEIFARSGAQSIQLNTLYQLLAMAVADSPLLPVAQRLLMMADLFNYWLAGPAVSELTIATTTQFFDPRAGDWSRGLLSAMGLPSHFLPPVVPSGTVLGPLLTAVAGELGVPAVPVVATAGHDTGSAVVGTPLAGPASAYVSSGTWSIVGAELGAPLIDARVLARRFGNEGGAASTWRLCRNVAGLWLVEECRRAWARDGADLSYDDLTALASAAPAFQAIVDPSDPSFLAPPDMPSAIRAYCLRTGQAPPESRGGIVRCVLEALALAYRDVLSQLGELLGRPVEVVHLVGGGSRNALLDQLTADAVGQTVLAGPAEATALGNVLVQLTALGHLASLAEARELVSHSFDPRAYEPGPPGRFDEAYESYLRLRACERFA